MKNKISKILGITLSSLLIPFCASCNSTGSGDKMSIVTTIFPEYDWVMNVLGEKKDNADVTLLLDNGIDLHSYQPTPKDIVTISKCDLFIYVGGESDEWVDDALKQAINKDMKVINLMETLGDAVKEEEVIEGMEEEDHDHDHEEGEEHDHEEEEEEVEYDEHVWLSIKNAEVIVKEIGKSLADIDKDNASVYTANVTSYVNSLKELDKKYADAVKAGSKDTLLFADRFPFRYFVDEYNLKYYAAFPGCSDKTEASAKTIAFLIDKIKEDNIPVILKLELSNSKIADTLSKETNTKVLTFNSAHNVSLEEFNKGITYVDIMNSNIDVLKEALN